MATENQLAEAFRAPGAQWKKYAAVAVLAAVAGSAVTLATVTRSEERIVDMHVEQSSEAKVEAKAEVRREVRREGRVVKTTRKVTTADRVVETTREAVTLPSVEKTEVKAESKQTAVAKLREEVRITTGVASRYSVRLAVDPLAPRNWQRADAEIGVRLGGLPLWATVSGSAQGVRLGGRIEF